MEERRFTIEEANTMLPGLAESLGRIQGARQVVLHGAQALGRTAPQNGGGTVGREYLDALDTLRREVESITGLGIVLRDPESGLVDFPSLRQGREVFLCWRVGEERVGYWHGPETGFSGRQPL
jgi:hypothetical protein